jgi:hypothetical protein
MTTGGRGIPRLQELSYLEVAATAVFDEVPFEGIRRLMVDHMIQLGLANPGTGNIAAYKPAIDNPKRYVRNVSEALKELMRLGLVVRDNLPATASSAAAFRDVQYQLTEDGRAWVERMQSDRAGAYDRLMNMLALAHPQFVGYLKIVANGFAVPTARWTEVQGNPTRDRYITHLSRKAAALLDSGELGWTATEQEIEGVLRTYTGEISARAEARERPDPFARNQDFVGACEEALVKYAFQRAGTPIDYISHEILRRWTKTLGLANFSYHVPGTSLLRFWATADLELADGDIKADRRVGPEWRHRVLAGLGEGFERTKAETGGRSLWVPIYKLRAAVCSKLRISDREFDTALLEMLAGVTGRDLPYRINPDPAMYGSVPPSARPLIAPTRSGSSTYHSISLVPRRDSKPGITAPERKPT